MKIKKFIAPPFHFSRRVIAKLWIIAHPKATIIGVTGSYGKTNTTMAIAYVLGAKFKTIVTDVNLDTLHNIPITILHLGDHEKLVLEYGVDHPGEMSTHLFTTKPKVAIVTGISPVHADKEHFGSLEKIIAEKAKLVSALPRKGFAILNWDDQNVRRMSQATKAQVIFYGTDPTNCSLWADRVKVSFKGTEFYLHVQGEQIKIKTQLVGRHYIYNLMAAAAVALTQKMTLKEIASAIENLKPLPGRLSVEPGPKNTVILNDSRRANPASTIAGLQTLDDLIAKRKIAVIGEMGELGQYDEEGHREVGKFTKNIKIDYLVGIGPSTKYIIDEAKKSMRKGRAIHTKDVFEAAGVLGTILQKGDLWYLKGSLLKHVERIILLLEGKDVDSDETAFHRYEVYR
ncbi:MAG: UDP-N-acetylmuramoyl-tripeptide--D-alanyl-D-alanine ligase [Candidatus Woykebacteria bacterium]